MNVIRINVEVRILLKSCIFLVNTVTKNVSKEADKEIKITDSTPPRFEVQLSSRNLQRSSNIVEQVTSSCASTLIRYTYKR